MVRIRQRAALTPRWAVPLCALLFLGSGFSALVYQVIWQRILGLFSGVHVVSVTTIVTAFMAGLGFGSLLGGRLADRMSRGGALLAFAGCEALIGLFGLASPWLLHDLIALRLGSLARFPALLPLIHFIVLLVPTLLMGASLPLLSRALVRRLDRAARIIGLLYGVNALGAAIGAAAAAWYLIGTQGLSGTLRLAAAVNLAVGLAALLALRSLGRRGRGERPEPGTAATAETAAPDGAGPSTRREPLAGLPAWCLLYGLSGFVALSLEIVWFRLLDVSIKSSPYTFGHLLAIFLGFMALGSLAGTLLAPKPKRPGLAFLWCQWGVSATAGAALLFVVLEAASIGWETLARYWHDPQGIELYELLWALEHEGERRAPLLISRIAQVYVALPLVMVALPTFLMGLSFPFVQRAVQTDPRAVGWRVGAVQAANILGSIIGALLTGAMLLSLLGTPATMRLLLAAGSLFALLALLSHRGAVARSGSAIALVASLLLAWQVPGERDFWARLHGSEPEEVTVSEDASGLAVMQDMRGVVVLRLNGRAHALVPFGNVTTLYGMIPALLHPEPRELGVIGLGTGETAWALGVHERLDVYELVRGEEIVVGAPIWKGGPYPPVVQLLADPALTIHYLDGRTGLRTRPRRYDLIETDALAPSMAFSGNLYSREFFELCRGRLKRGGLFVSWVPTERTLSTLTAVFPHLLLLRSEDLPSFAIGSNEPLVFSVETIRERLASAPVRAYLETSGESERTLELLQRFLDQVRAVHVDEKQRERIVGAELNTDLLPRDEFDKTYDGSYR
jgi:predicted membrane-bound spermidine synthase